MNLKTLIDRIESNYLFSCEAGPLKNCTEWQELRGIMGPYEFSRLLRRVDRP